MHNKLWRRRLIGAQLFTTKTKYCHLERRSIIFDTSHIACHGCMNNAENVLIEPRERVVGAILSRSPYCEVAQIIRVNL